MISSLCIIVRRPKGEELSTLGIRTAWATFAASVDTKVLFMQDGVFNLLENPGYNTDLLKKLLAEGGAVYGLVECLESRGISREQVLEGVEFLSRGEVASLVEESEAVATF